MHCLFHFQDPSAEQTTYLLETIIESMNGASACRAMFAFATKRGAELFLDDPAVLHFLQNGTMELVIGIDGITNRSALEYMQEKENRYSSLTVRVLRHNRPCLFHPKLLHISYADGRKTLIVGSGNLTPRGLMGNFEAYVVLSSNPGEELDLQDWDTFLQRHDSQLHRIDDEVLRRADLNIFHKTQRTSEAVELELEQETSTAPITAASAEARVLVAQIPAAGGRWHQVHFNKDVIEQFFRIMPNSSQRVYLRERYMNGSAGEPEIRPCVYAESNRNMKIELGARRHLDYPRDGPPIAVILETGLRTFEYVLLFPGEAGYMQMLDLTQVRTSLGKGVKRVVVSLDDVCHGWEACPLSLLIS